MKKKVIMIIDDDADDIMFFKEALEKMQPSYKSMEANCSIKALQFLRKSKQLPDYIFLDINMPIMDGRDCLNELKKDATLCNIPVIMYSTFFTEKNRKDFQALGASGYLTKPTDTNRLPSQIFEAIQ